ncbi:phenylacetate--CoA ligase family protein [Aeoliella sp. ICT_H6.2]|uniref:Phenylacetate--CoA ligase family protein n=1 Tax=Aeoliella straminimaris TaxID=2954799 RepID=A0A9X2JHW3_9BACT|nr:phenylacetate--CoA ligase family protein [Aeoliella straminimaris]MCO6046465.1 phenylacetate--CoA ligase family protein [Aeoliella straminimaris]
MTTPSSITTPEQRRQLESLDRPALEAFQLDRFNALLQRILPANEFYAQKLAGSPQQLESLAELAQLPFTVKDELLPTSEQPPQPKNLTYPLEAYVRFHQTSGTRGRPLPVFDTAEDWEWWLEGWQYVLDSAGITADDRAMLAFSFGPFIGFWTAFDSLVARGTLVAPGGGMSTLQRIDVMERLQTTALFCTPTYALHLAEVAEKNQIDLKHLPVKKIVVAGEPGGSIPSIRDRIESTWHAKLTDHSGASEIGAWGYGDLAARGLHITENLCIAEFISVDTGEPAVDGELSHLILTTLGRVGAPLIRYRTGDLVRPRWNVSGGNNFVLLEGGVLGRNDDMMVIRGVNIYPTSIEQILRSFPEVVEYRLTARKRGQMDSVLIEVEDRLEETDRIAAELQKQLGLSIEVKLVEPMSLPRFEGKGRRFIDER